LRGVSLEKVEALIAANTKDPGLAVFGEPAVNVLALNLALDGLK
jgi:K+-transporting ATPase ATPase C chain